jgi:hypothetical protein
VPDRLAFIPELRVAEMTMGEFSAGGYHSRPEDGYAPFAPGRGNALSQEVGGGALPCEWGEASRRKARSCWAMQIVDLSLSAWREVRGSIVPDSTPAAV